MSETDPDSGRSALIIRLTPPAHRTHRPPAAPSHHPAGTEGEMQPADEGPCAPKLMCRQQRGPCSTLKPFQSKRSAGKSRSAAAEPPRDAFSFHPEPHPFQQHQHQQQRLQQLHQSSVATSSSQQLPQLQQQRLPCESRPGSRVPTSTCATAEPRFSPDCVYAISTGGCPTSPESDQRGHSGI